jgi:hypothetical protein
MLLPDYDKTRLWCIEATETSKECLISIGLTEKMARAKSHLVDLVNPAEKFAANPV